MLDLSEELKLPAKLEEWVQTLPKEIEKIVREKPPTICYRSIENKGHFWLEGITIKDNVVSYMVLHGNDSFLPGFSVPYVNPESLMPCGCGEWQRPSLDQIEAAKGVADAILAAVNRKSPS